MSALPKTPEQATMTPEQAERAQVGEYTAKALEQLRQTITSPDAKKLWDAMQTDPNDPRYLIGVNRAMDEEKTA